MWVRRTCHISKMFFMKWAENFEEMSFLEVWFIIVWIFRAEPFLNYSIIYNHRYRLPLRYNFKWDYLEHFWVSHSNRQVTMSLNLLVYDAEYCQSPWTVTINVNNDHPSRQKQEFLRWFLTTTYINTNCFSSFASTIWINETFQLTYILYGLIVMILSNIQDTHV